MNDKLMIVSTPTSKRDIKKFKKQWEKSQKEPIIVSQEKLGGGVDSDNIMGPPNPSRKLKGGKKWKKLLEKLRQFL